MGSLKRGIRIDYNLIKYQKDPASFAAKDLLGTDAIVKEHGLADRLRGGKILTLKCEEQPKIIDGVQAVARGILGRDAQISTPSKRRNIAVIEYSNKTADKFTRQLDQQEYTSDEVFLGTNRGREYWLRNDSGVLLVRNKLITSDDISYMAAELLHLDHEPIIISTEAKQPIRASQFVREYGKPIAGALVAGIVVAIVPSHARASSDSEDLSRLTLDVGAGDLYNIKADYLQSIKQGELENDLFFLNLIGSTNKEFDETNASIGFGYRRALDSNDHVLGLNLFYDGARTERNKTHEELTIGGDDLIAGLFGSDLNLELFLNYHFPLSGKKLIGESIEPTSEQTTQQREDANNYYTDHITTTTTTTTRNNQIPFNEGLDGGLGFLWRNWQLRAGYHSLSGDDNKEIDGLNAFLGVALNELVSLRGEFREGNPDEWSAMIQLNIPIGRGSKSNNPNSRSRLNRPVRRYWPMTTIDSQSKDVSVTTTTRTETTPRPPRRQDRDEDEEERPNPDTADPEQDPGWGL